MKFEFKKTSMDIEVYVDNGFEFVIDVPDVNNLVFEDVYYELKRLIKIGLGHDEYLKQIPVTFDKG